MKLFEFFQERREKMQVTLQEKASSFAIQDVLTETGARLMALDAFRPYRHVRR
jgi:hypothetical protein